MLTKFEVNMKLGSNINISESNIRGIIQKSGYSLKANCKSSYFERSSQLNKICKQGTAKFLFFKEGLLFTAYCQMYMIL